MDPSLLIGAFSALKAAKDAAQAALTIRDFNAAGAAISRITDELLKAQQILLTQQAAMAELQVELEKSRRELAELREKAKERGRYSLFEITEGVFVYRKNEITDGLEGGEGIPEPMHYLCQGCFDKGVKAVLQGWGNNWHCPICKHIYAKKARAFVI